MPVGELTGYLLRVHNLSATAAPGVTVGDTLPAGFRVRDVGASPCAVASGVLTCTFDLVGGATRDIRVTGAFVVAGSVPNTATVSSSGDPVPGNDTSSTSTR